MDICYYNLENKTKRFISAERLFRIGDRVVTYFKPQGGEKREYAGTVVDIKWGSWPQREIYIRTDEIVDSSSGALFEGRGLRGPSSHIRFEDESPDLTDACLRIVELPLTEKEIQEWEEEEINLPY